MEDTLDLGPTMNAPPATAHKKGGWEGAEWAPGKAIAIIIMLVLYLMLRSPFFQRCESRAATTLPFVRCPSEGIGSKNVQVIMHSSFLKSVLCYNLCMLRSFVQNAGAVNCVSFLFFFFFCSFDSVKHLPILYTSISPSPFFHSPRAHLHVVGMLQFTSDLNQPSLPTPFCNSVLVSISVFTALSTVFHSINSPDNCPFSDSVLPVVYLSYWSSQLYISLSKTPSALI